MADEKKDPEGFDNRPTSQLDLERRLESGFRADVPDNTGDDVRNPEVVAASHVIEGNDTSAYRGVSPEYMNYSNVGDQPFEAEEGPEAESLKLLSGGVAKVRKTTPPDDTPGQPGIVATQTVYTGTSGENYSAELVDAPVERTPGPAVVMSANETPAPDATTTPKASAAPAKKTAAPTKSTSTNS